MENVLLFLAGWALVKSACFAILGLNEMVNGEK
jgi:hypothetical protein